MRLMRVGVLIALFLAGCVSWHVLKPLTANNVQVGQITLYVVSAEYTRSGGQLRLVVMADNRTGEPQPFDPHWIAIKGASNALFQPEGARPPMIGSIPPGTRAQVSYLFRHIPEPEMGSCSLMVAGTETMQFSGFY